MPTIWETIAPIEPPCVDAKGLSPGWLTGKTTSAETTEARPSDARRVAALAPSTAGVVLHRPVRPRVHAQQRLGALARRAARQPAEHAGADDELQPGEAVEQPDAVGQDAEQRLRRHRVGPQVRPADGHPSRPTPGEESALLVTGSSHERGFLGGAGADDAASPKSLKSFSRTLTTCLASATLVLATAGIAQAADPDAPATDVAETISAVAPEAGEVLQAAPVADAFAAQAGPVTVVVPDDAADPVAITSTDPAAPDLTVALPDLAGVDDARQAEDGTLVYTSDADASLAVQPLADGSTRFLSVLDNENAPERYDYTFDGFDLTLQADGSVLVTDGGEPVGFVAAPWATDADGVAVPTRYEVDGSTLTQVVEHTAGGFAYPLTADPKLTMTWWNTTIYFNKKETNTLAFVSGGVGIVAGTIPDVTATKVVAAAGGLLATYAGWVVSRGKCIKLVYYGTPLGYGTIIPQEYGGNEAGGYCR